MEGTGKAVNTKALQPNETVFFQNLRKMNNLL